MEYINDLLYTAGADDSIREWLFDGTFQRIFTVPPDLSDRAVWGLVIMSRQKILVSSGRDNKVRLWSLHSGLQVDEIDVCSSLDLIIRDETTL